MSNSILDQKTSRYIKAVAIVMMVIHHFFAFPDRWLESNLFITWGGLAGKPIEQLLGEMCKLCVCIFAFISGYGTYISFRKRTLLKQRFLYCVKKIVSLVFMYWIAMICFFIPLVSYFKGIGMVEIVNNLFLKSTSLVHTGWYVLFYVEAIICIFLYSFIEKENSWFLDCIICIGLPIILEILKTGNMFSHYYPTFMLGYIFSKYSLYQTYEKKVHSQILKYTISIVALFGLLIVRLKFGDTVGFVSMITFIGPIICYVLAFVLRFIARFQYIEKLLLFLTKYCTWYWFLHAIFHSGILLIQKIGYMPKIPILIIIWVFLILTPVAMLLQGIYNICIKVVVFLWNKRKVCV